MTTKESGKGILAKVQQQFSLRLSNRRLTTTRVPVSKPLVVVGREDIREIIQSATTVTGTTAASATRVVAKGVSRWGTRPKTIGAHGLRIRTSNCNYQLHKTRSSSNNGATGDVFSVVLKAISSEIAPR